MKRSNVTYSDLDRILRSMGFECGPGHWNQKGRVYQHASGALVALPALPEKDRAYAVHVASIRDELDNFGLLEASEFDAELQKAG